MIQTNTDNFNIFPIMFPETFYKVRGTAEPHPVGYFRDIQILFLQHLHGPLQSNLADKLANRKIRGLFYLSEQVGSAHTDTGGKFRNSELFIGNVLFNDCCDFPYKSVFSGV